MDATAQNLKQLLVDGHIDIDQVVRLVDTLREQNASLAQQLQTALQRIATLEKKLGPPSTPKLEQPFSVNAEEKRQEQRGKVKKKQSRKGKRGRLRSIDKVAQAARTEAVYPADIPPEKCTLSHTRPVWRIENGQGVLVAYQIYRGPGNHYGQIPQVLGKSEYGMEVFVQLAFLTCTFRFSFDRACTLLGFFQNLRLRKSQAEALLKQLARHWEREFETLCTLLAHSAVVHADETGWSLKSVWAFLSEQSRVIVFGVNKNGQTLRQILDSSQFKGLLVSDDAAVYSGFTNAQKCWAHLLRKAIKLTLLDPDRLEFRTVTDELLEIYREARRVQDNTDLSPDARKDQVRILNRRVFELLGERWVGYHAGEPLGEGIDADFRRLVCEIMRLMLARELFTFVTAEPATQPNGQTMPAGGTNNEAERTLRDPAQARATGRTSKTSAGARRHTILTSVLQSMRLYLPTFTLRSVLDEIGRWWSTGRSCFAERLEKLGLGVSGESVLDRLFPIPSG